MNISRQSIGYEFDVNRFSRSGPARLDMTAYVVEKDTGMKIEMQQHVILSSCQFLSGLEPNFFTHTRARRVYAQAHRVLIYTVNIPTSVFLV